MRNIVNTYTLTKDLIKKFDKAHCNGYTSICFFHWHWILLFLHKIMQCFNCVKTFTQNHKNCTLYFCNGEIDMIMIICIRIRNIIWIGLIKIHIKYFFSNTSVVLLYKVEIKYITFFKSNVKIYKIFTILYFVKKKNKTTWSIFVSVNQKRYLTFHSSLKLSLTFL